MSTWAPDLLTAKSGMGRLPFLRSDSWNIKNQNVMLDNLIFHCNSKDIWYISILASPQSSSRTKFEILLLNVSQQFRRKLYNNFCAQLSQHLITLYDLNIEVMVKGEAPKQWNQFFTNSEMWCYWHPYLKLARAGRSNFKPLSFSRYWNAITTKPDDRGKTAGSICLRVYSFWIYSHGLFFANEIYLSKVKLKIIICVIQLRLLILWK